MNDDLSKNTVEEANSFVGQQVMIATRHGKELVMAPLLRRRLGMEPFVLEGFDTDAFGTFTGEIERDGTPEDVLRRKILSAMKAANVTRAIGSEGSFGPHPVYAWVPCDAEHVMFIDTVRDLEILIRHVSLETNFDHQQISSEAEAMAFSERIGFPEHGVILRTNSRIIKDIQTGDELRREVAFLLSKGEALTMETDMRAMRNPTRMRVIEKATDLLIDAMLCKCPSCSTPGYSRVSVEPGLPCEWCGEPTDLILYEIFSCRRCGHESREKRSGKAPAGSCQQCNP